MSAIDFLDTNVLVYAYQFNDPHKQRVARDFVRRAVAGNFVISSQVLSEFAATLLHKFSSRVPAETVLGILDRLSPIKLIAADSELIRRAVEAQAAYGLHFYDCLIIAAAERAGCKRIWSEDFNDGQKYFGVTAANPFN
ncbi:MAG TPA: PIN domain-containing protein [Terriglobales bacterium]|nr:PIN domain-containing protein [Terriglobales bacterium]